MTTTTALLRHNPDTSPERLGDGWVYCSHCGWPIRRDEQWTSCEPRRKREYAKYLATKERIAKIEARMEARRAAFNKAQQADELAVHNLRTYGSVKRALSFN